MNLFSKRLRKMQLFYSLNSKSKLKVRTLPSFSMLYKFVQKQKKQKLTEILKCSSIKLILIIEIVYIII